MTPISAPSPIRMTMTAAPGYLAGKALTFALREGLFYLTAGELHPSVMIVTGMIPVLGAFIACTRIFRKISDAVLMTAAAVCGGYAGGLGVGGFYWFAYGMSRMGDSPGWLMIPCAMFYSACVFLSCRIGAWLIGGDRTAPHGK